MARFSGAIEEATAPVAMPRDRVRYEPMAAPPVAMPRVPAGNSGPRALARSQSISDGQTSLSSMRPNRTFAVRRPAPDSCENWGSRTVGSSDTCGSTGEARTAQGRVPSSGAQRGSSVRARSLASVACGIGAGVIHRRKDADRCFRRYGETR
jgi:hypothetical protein